MTTIDDILSRKRANTETLWIPLDSTVAAEFQEAESDFNVKTQVLGVRPSDPEAQRQADEAQAALDDAKTKLRENSIKFVFTAVGRKRYEQLVLDHPATEAQRRKAREKREDAPDFNEDTFPIALVAASMFDPMLSEEDVKKMWESDQFSLAELRQVFMAAIRVNTNYRIIDLGKE